MNYITAFDPYIFIWAIIIAISVFSYSYTIVLAKNLKTSLITGIVAFFSIFIWNYTIELNQSTIYLNVDHPIFRISWADFWDSILVTGILSFGLNFINNITSKQIIKISLFAFIITLFADIFLF